MAKGENIFRRRDGRWEARYIKGREPSGKIKYGYCYGKTYREAKEKAAKRKAALENGALLPTATTQKPFSSYCLGWLHTKKCTVKESTYIKYSTAVNKHIMPKLGECCPLGFTTELMDDFIKELQFEDELAPKTVHDILVVLHGILKFASSKFAGSFPAVEINYPKIGKKEMRVLSREEQARLVAYLHEDLDSCRFGILLALCTGIRIGELCALQWESVSTNDKAIRIAKTLQRLHDTSVSQGARTRIVIGPPKSDTSVRTIPMTEYATGLCRRMKPQSSAAYVLTGTEAFMEPRTLQYRLEKYTQACGLEGVHFHMPILYSCHPRSRKRLEATGFQLDTRVIAHEPLGFLDYNCLQMNAFAVVSDSGTLPEESSFFLSVGKPFPAVSIRTSTERPEALDAGCFVLAGIDVESLLQAVEMAVGMQRAECFGTPVADYTAENVSMKVAKIIQSYTGIVNKMVWRKDE